MRIGFYLSLLLTILILMNFGYALININSCTNDPSIAGQIYELTQNISINGATCLEILQDNITLDCKGYSITGDLTGATYGIDVFIHTNVTIQNCDVYKFGNGVRLAGGGCIHSLLNITSSNNSNNGIWLNSCSNNIIENLTASYNGYQGFYIQGASYNQLNNIEAHNNTQYAIYFSNGDNNTISNSNLTTNVISNIHLKSGSQENIFINNYLGINSSITGSSIVGNSFNGNYWDDLITYPYCLENAPSLCDAPILILEETKSNNIFPLQDTRLFGLSVLLILSFLVLN